MTILLRCTLLLACPLTLAVNCHAKTHKHAKPHPWASSISVAPDAPASVATIANPVCGELTSNAGRHAAKVQALTAAFAKSSTAPPSTVYGTIKSLLGDAYVSSADKEKARKLESEKKAVAELNAMLVAAQCKPVDVEHDVAVQPPDDASNARNTSDEQLRGLVDGP